MSKNLLIVESPAKAKTIAKYLGSDFAVKSSVGHIREIPRKGTQVDIKNDFATNYEVSSDKKKVVSELKTAAKGKEVYLATDPDREGEAIAWHLQQVLKLPADVKRVTYHEITKNAVEAAVASPRAIDMDLVAAQQARQILDRIVGYELSPVVWRKVPGGKSAGRVQSPALRLIVEREREIEAFDSKSEFKVTGDFLVRHSGLDPESSHDNKLDSGSESGMTAALDTTLTATLDTTFPDENSATKWLESLNGAKYIISDINSSNSKRNPAAPFTTSTLQQDASVKFGWSAKTTMSAAQKLYQQGRITYMRTDSVSLSDQALGFIGRYIEGEFGKNYLTIRKFKTKSSSAQEAHEAIRPTDITLEHVGSGTYEAKLYDLIRRRTLASQMSPAEVEKTEVAIVIARSAATKQSSETNSGSPRSAREDSAKFIAKGEVVLFDGFLKVYGSNKELDLPKLAVGDELTAKEITARQNFAKPPARYTEGSLIKKLESLGIGRPSTYATIMEGIQNRGYAIKGNSEGNEIGIITIILQGQSLQRKVVQEKRGADKGKLVPTDIGKILSDFLSAHFDHVMDYGWTARIEDRLDQIAEGKMKKVEMLKSFYAPFHDEVAKSDDIDRSEVVGQRELGKDPATGKPIYARMTRYGAVLQVGEGGKDVEEKPRFVPLPEGKSIDTVTIEDAQAQLLLPQLPRTVGKAADGTELIANKGPFGPYLKAGNHNISLGKGHDPYTIDLSTAKKLYKEKLDSIIADWGEIKIIKGAYGPYIKGPGRRNNAKIDKDLDPAKITEQEARKMLAEYKPRKMPRRASKRKITKKK